MSTATNGFAEKGRRRRKKRSTRSKRYVYTLGDTYPGIVFGHKQCVGRSFGVRGVPPHMGWLWNFAESRKGWRPGALGKSVLKLMKLKLGAGPVGGSSRKNKLKKKQPEKSEVPPSEFPSEFEDDPVEPKAALQVSKKGDLITVVVNPLKDVSKLDDGEDPFMGCDPIIFKLMQQPSAKKIAKRAAKERKKYEEEIKKALEEALKEICQCAYEDVYCTDLNAIDDIIEKVPAFAEEPKCNCDGGSSSSSDSEWDIEYTPPFAMTHLKPRRPIMVHEETQYSEQDCQVKRVKMFAFKGNSMDSPFPKVARSSSKFR